MTERRRKKYEKTLLCLSRNHYFFLQDLLCAVYALFCYFSRKKNIASIIITIIFINTKLLVSSVFFTDQSDQSIRPSHQSQLLNISLL